MSCVEKKNVVSVLKKGQMSNRLTWAAPVRGNQKFDGRKEASHNAESPKDIAEKE
jgi:hypothetical protein